MLLRRALPALRAAGRAVHADARGPEVRLANSLSGRLEPLQADAQGVVTWYTCGPTVYDAAHLGHARTYVGLDVVRRVLRRFDPRPVRMAMGVTDVDDKILRRARELGVPAASFAREQEAAFFADMAALGVEPPDVLLRVTEHIPEIVAYVEGIRAQGKAYDGADGVYFDTRAFGPGYGSHLAKGRVREAEVDADAEPDARGKRAPADFALWKRDDGEGEGAELSWDSPWGRGRPGWHIECSAMAHAVFGPALGLHTGGIDLLFPHHTNEIAQCEAHNAGAPWASCFAHTGHLHIAGRKMSKSLKNFVTVRELLDSPGVSAAHFRWFCLLHRYNSNVNFSDDRMADAAAVHAQFEEFLQLARSTSGSGDKRRWGPPELELAALLSETERRTPELLARDVDTPAAVAQWQALVRATSAYVGAAPRPLAGELVAAVARYVEDELRQLGVAFSSGSSASSSSASSSGDAAVDAAVAFRGAVREAARAGLPSPLAKELLRLCDEFRDEGLPAAGVRLQDAPAGAVWRWSS